MKRDEEYNRLAELEQEIILTVSPRANEHLLILTTIDLKRGSDYDNQFIVFISANTLRANQVRYAFRKKFPRL
jgi:hypothetical protein